MQCKEYKTFTSTQLREAVQVFAEGKRPFGARHLIVALSLPTRTTQLEDELAVLQDERGDLDIELWGAEQINEVLRHRADIVSRFWTRETAETFCTGAPLPGVAAAPPNWLRMANQILLSPLGVDGLEDRLIHAETLRAGNPESAAAAFKALADTVAADGFTGHANVLRHKQLDALADAGRDDAVAALTAQLAATALYQGDLDEARRLAHRLDALARVPDPSAGTVQHAGLLRAAVSAATHPLGETTALLAALRNLPTDPDAPSYMPLLVLLLAEFTAAQATIAPSDRTVAAEDGRARLAEMDDLIVSAIHHASASIPAPMDHEVVLRLRLVHASYDADERKRLLVQARQLRLPRAHAALILAAQARREALEGSAEEAVEHWRQAVAHAIHEGLTDAASGWLYAIRAVNARYGPWTDRIDDEHLLAQGLPKSSSGQLIRRVRDPENNARRAALDQKPIEAVQAARRWLADSIVTGDWVDEHTAAELLGDLYSNNAEPERAAACYEWAGENKKLTELAAAVGDRPLPTTPIGSGPWWQQAASLAVVQAQHDLLDDDTAADLLAAVTDLAARGRAGELTDSPTHVLYERATKAACVLAGRGTSSDAQALLDLLAADVERGQHNYFPHDDEHVQACLSIAAHHPELATAALERIFGLAEYGADKALHALQDQTVLQLLEEPASAPSALTEVPRQGFRDRLATMAGAGRYMAELALAKLGDTDRAVTERALEARDRLLSRAEPDGYSVSYGTRMVPDSYLVTFLDEPDQRACLEKMLTVAADRREAAPNRQDALIAASNLVLDMSDDVKASVHLRSRAYVEGDQDGSFLDTMITNPHPLSSMKIDMGSASQRAIGLRLCQYSAVTAEDKLWVRDRTATLLGSNDQQTVREAALALSRLGTDVTGELDAGLLAVHPMPVVRQLAAVLVASAPTKHGVAVKALAEDSERSVRALLAEQLHAAQTRPGLDGNEPDTIHEVGAETLRILQADIRHSVRRTAHGLKT